VIVFEVVFLVVLKFRMEVCGFVGGCTLCVVGGGSVVLELLVVLVVLFRIVAAV